MSCLARDGALQQKWRPGATRWGSDGVSMAGGDLSTISRPGKRSPAACRPRAMQPAGRCHPRRGLRHPVTPFAFCDIPKLPRLSFAP
jgi:hypothetical protein